MRYSALFIAIFVATAPAAAQQAPQRVLTEEDYARAEQYLGQNTGPLVFGASVRPTWLESGRFWYRNTIPEGAEFVMVDPERRTRARAFDHQRLAAALSAAADTTYDPFDLPFTTFHLEDDGRSISFEVRPHHYTCDTEDYRCRRGTAEPQSMDRNAITSPDGKYAAFIRDHNLWVRETETGDETQLTSDGIEDFGYATNNAGWVKSDRPVLLWSPDSEMIATFQHDGRGVGEMYMVSTNVGHPRLEAWKYPLPEDTVIFRIHRVVIHLDGPRVVRLQMPPDQHRSTVCDHIACRGTFADVEWSADGSQLAFVSTSRDHKHSVLRVADPETGAVRDVLEETVETFYESGANWRLLAESDEVLWYSHRDNWGHLYLYDLESGRLKHQVTTGDWNVLSLVRIDDRTLYFSGVGREPGDPYFRYLYRVRMDGSDLALLTPDSADHTITLAPSARYFVDSYSTPDTPPIAVLCDISGRKLVDLEEADISQLLATGWTPPIPFSVKARDGVTDLYGLMYRPTDFDPAEKYAIINSNYPGPQSGSVGRRSFSASRGDTRALAELGFIVVQLDAMGTPNRSKTFHETYYGNMGDNGLPDQITGMEQLAERHPWIDLDRAGIYGHSGGGFSSADAIMRYPDFFKVAVSQAGNHDNRNYEDDWGEKWQGLLVENADGTTNYDNQANQLLAENLKGKLLIAHGTMDGNVPYYNTLLVVNELIAANKDFDFILFPNRGHGFGRETYMTRRRWDYFVRHLMGAEPPAEYEFQPAAPRRF
jgi:dipeptidyl aminopeptidase/acylaminoacyl peptidase